MTTFRAFHDRRCPSYLPYNDFDRPENCAFTILKGESLQEFVKNFGVRSAELSVRTKCPMTEDEMYAFLEKTADRMTVNNTFVTVSPSLPTSVMTNSGLPRTRTARNSP